MAQVNQYCEKSLTLIDTDYNDYLMKFATKLLENVIKFQGRFDIAAKTLKTNPRYVYEDLQLEKHRLTSLFHDSEIQRYNTNGRDKRSFESIKNFFNSSNILKFNENSINILRKHFDKKQVEYDFFTTIESFFSEFIDKTLTIDDQFKLIESVLEFTSRVRVYLELQILTMSIARQNMINMENNIKEIIDFINSTY